MKNKINKKTIIRCFILLLILLICCAYIIILHAEKTHFALGTSINNINVSLKTPNQVYKLLNNNNKTVKFTEDDNTYNIQLNNVASVEISLDNIKKAFEDNKSKSFKIFNKKNIFLKENVSVDSNALEKLLNSKITRKPSVDSNYEITNNNFKYNEAYYGNEIDFDKLNKVIKNGIKKGIYEFEIDNSLYKKPNDIDYSDFCNSNNKLLNHNLTIQLYNDKKIELNKDQIIIFLKTDENNNYIVSDNKIILDDTKIEDYVQNLKDKYDTYGKSQNFKTTNGETIKVDTNCWGWEIDKEETSQLIKSSILDTNTKKIEPIYKSTAFNTNNTIGDTYIEISIAQQHVWYYKNGNLVFESDCVTGDAGKKRDTPTGLYYILEKIDGKYLRGPGYKTWVNKWMRVTWSGIGLHDSYWRKNYEYGGTTYKNNGSHGCINLPPENAAKLYDLISVKDPVIIY